jgi:hypothetical protein
MTIQEAIKSGKPFKRSIDSDWLVTTKGLPDIEHNFIIKQESGVVQGLFVEDCLADDWEVKQ